MNVIAEEYLQSVINDIANELKLKEWTYNKQSFDNIAQNYFGVLIPIHLSGKGDDVKVDVPFVLKLAPTDERFRVSGAVTLFFAREIYVYLNVLQKYEQIQRNFPLSAQFVMPKCYYARKDYCNELLAIQNMCESSYKPYVDGMFLDIAHIKVALISLARFHALSCIFEKTDAKRFEEAKEICVPLNGKTNKRFMDILVDRLQKALEKFNETDYVPLLEALKHNCVSIIESAASSVKTLCLCHGDIWKENIMFKYEDNLPTSACIIDYQTTRVSSPAFDLLYLIVSSTSAALRKEHFSHIVNVYYKTFEETLKYANLNPKDIYSKDMLEHDLKIVGPACLIVANTAIWLASGLQEEGHVKSKVVLKTEEEKLMAVAKYKDIISSIIDDLSHNNYLNKYSSLIL